MISLSTKDWKMDNIKTALFDKDGTFIDLHYFWGKMTEMRVSEIMKRYNLSSKYFNELCLSLGYDVNTCKMLPDGITALYSRIKIIEIFKKDLENYGLFLAKNELEEIFDYVSTEFYKSIKTYIKPITEAVEFIKQLYSQGIKLGIVTSDSKESTDLTLKYLGLENLFDVVIGRESSVFTKESGEPTKLALKALNANVETTVMIGDAPMDFVSANNAGVVKTILVATGQIKLAELKNISQYAVNSLSEILPEN